MKIVIEFEDGSLAQYVLSPLGTFTWHNVESRLIKTIYIIPDDFNE